VEVQVVLYDRREPLALHLGGALTDGDDLEGDDVGLAVAHVEKS